MCHEYEMFGSVCFNIEAMWMLSEEEDIRSFPYALEWLWRS